MLSIISEEKTEDRQSSQQSAYFGINNSAGDGSLLGSFRGPSTDSVLESVLQAPQTFRGEQLGSI